MPCSADTIGGPAPRHAATKSSSWLWNIVTPSGTQRPGAAREATLETGALDRSEAQRRVGSVAEQHGPPLRPQREARLERDRPREPGAAHEAPARGVEAEGREGVRLGTAARVVFEGELDG